MSVLTVKNLYKPEVINAKIDAFAKRGLGVQAEAHKLACSVLLHLGQHGDVTVVQRFVMSMPDSMRTNGLRAWFEAFGPIKFTQVGEGKDATETVTHIKGKEAQIGKAIAKPFWKFSANEGKPYEPLDMAKYVGQVIKRLQKDQEETGVDHSALISALTARTGMSKVSAAKVQPVRTLDAVN